VSGWWWIALGVEGVAGMAYWGWQVVGVVREQRALTDTCRVEEQTKTAALIEQLRERQ
jgi:hypothetical protein